MNFGTLIHLPFGVTRIVGALALMTLLAGCEKDDSENTSTSKRASQTRQEFERDHASSIDRRMVYQHAMYVGEIPLDEEPVMARVSNPRRPEAKHIERVMKNSHSETAQSGINVPAPEPGWEYQR